MKKQPLRLRTYALVSRAVEEGVAHGIRRYLKYDDRAKMSDEGSLAEHLEHEILNALCEVVDFGDDT